MWPVGPATWRVGAGRSTGGAVDRGLGRGPPVHGGPGKNGRPAACSGVEAAAVAPWPHRQGSPRRRGGARELVPRARAWSSGFGEADARDGCAKQGPVRTGPRGSGGSTMARTPARPCGAKGGRKRDLRAPTHSSRTSEARGRLTLARMAAERDASRRPRSSTGRRRRCVLRGLFRWLGIAARV